MITLAIEIAAGVGGLIGFYLGCRFCRWALRRRYGARWYVVMEQRRKIERDWKEFTKTL